jgi:UPF0755 protein
MRKSARNVFIGLVLWAAVAGVFAYRWIDSMYTAPGPTTQVTRFEVAPGNSVRSVLYQLGQRGVVLQPRAVSLYLRLHGLNPKIKAGTYDLPAEITPREIFRMLEDGAVILEQFTVVEGSTFADLRRTLEKHPAVQVTLRGKSDDEVMGIIGHPGEHPEGRFFPDTYRFAAKTSDVELLKLAYGNMDRVLTEAWKERKPDLPLKTPYEALTLASIVEKETALENERAMIAGVFIARLRLGMRLQTDPTVIYGLGSKYDGDIRTKDLSTDTPYNTYTRAGLPPTPISLPGRESVVAALNPDETGAIFFVATGDGSGAHYFSKTLEEHNQAVRRLLARLRQQQSGPPKHTTIQSR